MGKSRTYNSALNITMGISYKLLTLILHFMSRTIFIKVLGVEFLGINGLFANVLSVLSLAEMGIGTALVYSMYKPLEQNDRPKLTALINYYKKLYTIIALIITTLGLALVPFLDYLVKLDTPLPNVTIYYLLFLANSVMSYFFVYRTSIAIADQKDYKLKVYHMVFAAVTVILQIIVLLTTGNYIIFLIVQIICSLLVNILTARKTTKLYPYIKEHNQLEDEEKKEIWSNIKSFFYYRIGGVILNNTDNILISVMLGTVWVGYYSNYSMVIMQITGFASIIFTSLQASFGNLNAEGNTEKQYFMFRATNLFSFWVFGFCCICFIVLFEDFIILWLGSSFLINKLAVLMAVMTFYLQGVLYPIWLYRQTTGLFKYTKYTMFYASLINLALSIILGYRFGLTGILAATVVARLLTNIWYEPYILHRLFFNKSPKNYYLSQVLNIILLSGTAILTSIVATKIEILNPFASLALKLLLCILIPNVIFFLVFRKTDEFRYLYDNSAGRLLKLIYGTRL